MSPGYWELRHNATPDFNIREIMRWILFLLYIMHYAHARPL
jgi:hypothetical protein